MWRREMQAGRQACNPTPGFSADIPQLTSVNTHCQPVLRLDRTVPRTVCRKKATLARAGRVPVIHHSHNPPGERENQLRIVVRSFALPATTLPTQILYTSQLNERARHGDSWVCSNQGPTRDPLRHGRRHTRGMYQRLGQVRGEYRVFPGYE